MRDYIEIGCVPADEDCEQVGMPTYDGRRARLECETFRDQLRRQFGDEPEGATLRVKSNPHDFGNYLEVACYFDTDSEEAVAYAFKCEGEAWTEWDVASREKLGTDKYPLEQQSESIDRRASEGHYLPADKDFDELSEEDEETNINSEVYNKIRMPEWNTELD
jgi:hypothetical protein